MKVYRILGKRGRITIPLVLRQRVGFSPDDVLSFVDQDDHTVLVRREPLCQDKSRQEAAKVTLLEFLDSLSVAEQHTALVHLSVQWAERQGRKGEKGNI